MKFFTSFLSAIILGCIFWALLVLGQSGKPTASSRWVFEAYQIKKQRANSLAGTPKIVIVSGSNALFGIDSQMLESAFSRPVVNGGINAGLLLPYILDSSKNLIGPGDVVLMPLEYPMYNHEHEINPQLLDYVIARDPDYFWKLSFLDKFRFLAGIDLNILWSSHIAGPDQAVERGLYGGHNININGDQIHTRKSDQTYEFHQEVLNAKAKHYGKDSNFNSNGWQLIKEYKVYLDHIGACMILLPPAFLFNELYVSDPVEFSFYNNLPEIALRHGILFLGTPFDTMYPKDWFFNSDYHLDADSRTKHTAKLIQLFSNHANPCGIKIGEAAKRSALGSISPK